jgi:hypothetical protein
MQRLEAMVSLARRLPPGKYGGLYVIEKQFGDYYVLDHDEPEDLEDDRDFSIVAHVTQSHVTPIGSVVYYLNTDGTTRPEYFNE